MRVKFKQCLAGSNFCHNPGDVCEFADEKASRLIEAGIAEPVKAAAKLETATVPQPPVEKAIVDDGFAPADLTPNTKLK